MITRQCTLSYWSSSVLCKQRRGELKGPQGVAMQRSEKSPGGGSAWTKYERMSKCFAWQSVADARWCVKEEQRLFLEVRWSCNGDTKAILWNREWAVWNDLERWEVITSYAAVSRSWRSFRRWARGQESTIQNEVLLCEKASSTRACSFALGQGVMPLGEGWWG